MKSKRKLLFVILIILGILVIGVSSFIFYQDWKAKKENDRLLLEIKNSYAPYVMTKKDKKIYLLEDHQYQEIGIISKDTIIPLISKEIKNTSDIYYQIQNTSYYIDYMDLIEVKDYQEDTSLDSYVVTTNIRTIPTKLYQENQVMISLDKELEFDVLFQDNDKYYIKFLNGIYYIKDSYELVEKDHIDTLKDISVLNFSDDISNEKLEEVLKFLKENHYETISLTDFIRWINGQVSLENNKVLLLSYKELDEEKKKLVNEYGYLINTHLDNINFVSGDTKLKVGDTKYYKYEIDSNTTLDRVKDILNGIPLKIVSNNQGIAVLNYHFFYDSSIGEACNESICIDVSNFRKQLDYLRDNNYKVLTMQEFNDWMNKKITLPSKSVLITIDDGALGTGSINGNKLIPILEEYQMHATLFLITGWWDKANYQSDYLEIYSHGDELHHNNFCRDGTCTYKGLLLSKEELKKDLQLSINKIGSNLAFCYPFYAKNNTLIEALKETGFQIAFVGGNRKAKQTDNKYMVPRYVVYKNTSLNNFINMVK